MSLKFTAKDFIGGSRVANEPDPWMPISRARSISQNLFDAWLAKQTVVYTKYMKHYLTDPPWRQLFAKDEVVTHQAYLVDNRPIEKKECEHEPDARCYCVHCDKQLKPTGWELVDD